jgi:L,D-transpeptidase ErfK/SrfK
MWSAPAAPDPVQRDPVPTYVFELADGQTVVGGLQRIRATYEDTLADLARLFDLGHEEITRANPGVDAWLPGAGTEILLPTLFVLPDTPREGLVLNLASMRLYYYPPVGEDGRRLVYTHPIGIGRVGWSTPLGTTRVTAKATNPSWYVPESIRKEHAEEGDPLPAVVPPGPDNPLGKHVLRLAMPGYLIHGTNKPWGVGLRVSHGCIRLYPEDIEALYKLVPKGTPVHIIDQPYLTGWHEGRLLFQAHVPLEERGGDWLSALELIDARLQAAPDGVEPGAIDWGRAASVARDGMGVPFPIEREELGRRAWLGSVPLVRTEAVAYYRPEAALDETVPEG